MPKNIKAQHLKMAKFRKEITIAIEGELFDDSLDHVEIFKSLKFSWKHWWEKNPNWIYGKPTNHTQIGRIDKIFLNETEIKNEA
jgi:hypothetical protein